MSKSFERGLLVLRMIPHYPRHITSNEIFTRLVDEHGIDVTIRTVQNDLKHISNVYPLQRSDYDHTTHYYWPQGSQVELVPGHDDYSALTWNLLEQYLEPLLPEAMGKRAQPIFETARKYLARDDRSQIKDWTRRVRMIPRMDLAGGQPIDESVRGAVYECLWERESVCIDYIDSDTGVSNTMLLHPQGITLMGNIVFLVAQVDGEDSCRSFALHKIQRAESTYRPSMWIDDLYYDAWLEKMNFSSPDNIG